jgi:hypothetical protein
MTGPQFFAWLKETGQYEAFVERQRQREEERSKREEKYRRAEAPLVAELRAAGHAVDSAWDLVNTPGAYPSAVPILMGRAYPGPVREGIARALAVPEAKDAAWGVLTRLFRKEKEERVKDGLAAAIAAAADDEVIGDVIALVRDKRHGSSRVLLLSALDRSADSRARAALMALGTDPDLAKEIQFLLRRRKRRQQRANR